MTNRASFIGIAPIFVVPDVAETAAYYQRSLGFTLLGSLATPPVYAMVERDGIQLHFCKSDTGEFHTNNDTRSIAADCIIWAPNIEALFTEWTANGVTIEQPILQRPYGREFIIQDCNGYRIAVVD